MGASDKEQAQSLKCTDLNVRELGKVFADQSNLSRKDSPLDIYDLLRPLQVFDAWMVRCLENTVQRSTSPITQAWRNGLPSIFKL